MSDAPRVGISHRGAFIGIGVSTYDHDPPYARLARAVADVTDLAQELRLHGYMAKLVPDPTKSEADHALSAWRDEYKPATHGGSIILFWAGHGAISLGQRFLLVTRDTAQAPASSDALAPGSLAETAAIAGADLILLVIDACFSGAGLMAAVNEAVAVFSNQSFPDNRLP